jgi:sugar phosphate isomerase/epimerase
MAGYTTVETYGFSIKDQFWGLSAFELKKIVDANGLKCVSGHYGLGSFLVDGNTVELMAAIEAAKILNSQYITISWIDASLRKSGEAYKKIATGLNQAGKLCKSAGLKLAYHNHDFEFEQFDGITGYEILLKETDTNLVDFEMDLYWVVRSGNDPLRLFAQYPGRFKLWHVKDMDKSDHSLNAEIGSGSIDFKTIFKQTKQAGMQYIFVEQENNFKINSLEGIKSSCDFVTKELI